MDDLLIDEMFLACRWLADVRISISANSVIVELLGRDGKVVHYEVLECV